jgi:Recombination endonuclease VII
VAASRATAAFLNPKDNAVKRCTKCGEEKPLAEFYDKPQRKDGKSGWCRTCDTASCSRTRTKHRMAVGTISWARRRLANGRANAKVYGHDPPNNDPQLAIALWNDSDGVCQCCHNSPAVSLDHCHKTGELRGWLCQMCNVGLGFYERHKNNMERYLNV